MDYDYLSLSFLFTFFLTFAYALTITITITIYGRRNSRLPPGPFPFPIIGNLLHLGDKPHHSLATLSRRYGPLMSLKLGTRTTIVVSSPDIAKEFFQTHDHSFSSRSLPAITRVVDQYKYSIVWLPAGDQWRRLRRISKEYMFSVQRLDASEPLRHNKFDPQGLVRRGNVYGKRILTIFDRVINQRLQTRSKSSTNNDLLDSLLNLEEIDESSFNRNDMRHLFYALFIAGTDTTSSTLEWAMAELIYNPDKLEMARSEVIKLMDNKNNIIQESDISQLPYLQAVIKETLRLHPPVPFLVPHQAIFDVEIQGFMVPKNAQILCNVWAMGRDTKVWAHPETFMPERFLKVNIDYKGQDFELIPFGAGRRMCPGLNMAHRMLHIMLASLIQKFDWKLEGNIRAKDMDMSEKFGLTLQKNVPLKAIPVKI